MEKMKIKRCRKHNPKTGEMGFSVKEVGRQKVTWDDLVADALSHTSFSRGEGEGVLIMLTDRLRDRLRSGYPVEVRGLGTFRLQARSPWTPTASGQHKDDVKASIRFEPCRELRNYLDHPFVEWTGQKLVSEKSGLTADDE